MILALLSVLAGCVTEKRMALASARTDLGIAYYKEGSLESAVSALEEAQKADPRNWRTLNTLAVVYVAKGRDDLAEKTFERAVRIAPKEAELLVSYGAFLVRKGRPDEAVGHFRSALADLDYRNPAFALSNLAYALTLTGQGAEAVRVGQEAVRRAPDLCEAWFNLGLAYEAAGDVTGAVTAWKTQGDRCPAESIGSRLKIGCIEAKHGQSGAAVGLGRVIDEAPNTPYADEARSCLAMLGAG